MEFNENSGNSKGRLRFFSLSRAIQTFAPKIKLCKIILVKGQRIHFYFQSISTLLMLYCLVHFRSTFIHSEEMTARKERKEKERNEEPVTSVTMHFWYHIYSVTTSGFVSVMTQLTDTCKEIYVFWDTKTYVGKSTVPRGSYCLRCRRKSYRRYKFRLQRRLKWAILKHESGCKARHGGQ